MSDAVEFNPLSADFFDDPYATYRRLRDEAPCYRSEQYGFYALTRYDDVVAAHRDWETFTSTRGISIDQLTGESSYVPASIIFLDPPEHDTMRKLVSRVFTPRAVGDLEPRIREIVAGYLDRLDPTEEIDLLADFAAPFPVEVISMILGIPEADRQQFRHWVDELLSREPDDPKPTQAGMEAALHMTQFVYDLVREKRRRPTDDMLTALTEVEVDDDDGVAHRLTDDDIAGFATLIGAAGSETVTKMVGNGVVLFHRNPDEWRTVLADPIARLPLAMEEVLRYWAPSQYQGRFATRSSTWHGVEIPADAPVILVTGAANRDERAYAEPDRFDVHREPRLSVGLGHGIHLCLGAALARLESRVAFDELGRRFPDYEVDERRCERVHMSNVAGYSRVPVRVR
jgi:cytochrome P450